MSTKKSDEFILTPSKPTIIPTSDHSQSTSTSSSYSSLNVSLPTSDSLKEGDNLVFGNDILETSPSKMGNVYTFFYYKAQPLITIGPDYQYSITLISIIVGVYLLEFFTLFSNNPQIIKIIETGAFLIEITSYLLTMLINPGIPSRYYHTKNIENTYEYINSLGQPNRPYLKCNKCNLYVTKDMKVVHCKTCNVCVMNQDHHCPWTGKCIGKNNLYTFYIFVTFLFVFIMTSFVTFLTYIVFTIDKMTEENHKK